MVSEKRTGHLAALLTILIWGTTFISTKILLTDFQPVEILFFRFIMGNNLCCCRLLWSMSVLFAGKWFIDLYNGF